jgi:hypothetical protein
MVHFMQNLEQHDIYKLIGTWAHWNRTVLILNTIIFIIRLHLDFSAANKDNLEKNGDQPDIW